MNVLQWCPIQQRLGFGRSLKRFALGAAACCTASMASCNAHEAAPRAEPFPEAETRRRSAATLVVETLGAPDAALTEVVSLAVDSRGNVYVPDYLGTRVVVLNGDGTVLRVLGRRGRGPGEFLGVRGVQVLRGDSVLVYDPVMGRISVFAPDSTRLAYGVELASVSAGALPFEVRRTSGGEAFVALYRPQFAFGTGAEAAPRLDQVRLLAPDGAPRRDLLEYPSKAFLVAGTSVMPHPFGSEGFVALDARDRLYQAWSDTLGVSIHDLAGTGLGGFRIDYEPPPLRRSDADAAIAAIPAQVRERFRRPLADSMRARWPAVLDLLLDDEDRVWLALGGRADQPTEWACFSAKGAYLGSMLVPAETAVHAIRARGIVYASSTDADGVPRVVTYRMLRSRR
jgi:hypothetical protein